MEACFDYGKAGKSKAYCREGHLVIVRHGNREKGGDPGNSGLEAMARDLLRELAEDGTA